jgi:cysteine desulfurase
MATDHPLYFDNAATTRVAPEVADVVAECMLESYGNPSSAHQAGIVAEKRVKAATRQLGAAIGDPGADHGQIVWTSGGTESDALGVIGPARRRLKQPAIVISALEHPAVRESAKLVSPDVRELPATAEGSLNLETLGEIVDGSVGVLAVMLVNNEIGTILPVAELAEKARALQPKIHIHCDAVQALGKIPVDAVALGVDSLAFAAHKLHGPKGVGALWLRKGAKLAPLWDGGGQQAGLRSGTFNVPGIAGMGAAAELATVGLEERRQRFLGFGTTLVDACKRANLRFRINGEQRAGHVLSLAFEDCPAEPLLHVLESRGVLVSAGSACSERDRKPSPVLKAISVPENFGTLRFSFGRDTTQEQVEEACKVLIDAVQTFQR